ncbi:MAG: poly(R)-hydroxyalkanoic acid synthase subunit PhaE [Myxococcota bacterium]|nr:poly(R)-hydroxyalkanoic acid synthase subunit PhaE [Myxococcota bacterium]
MTEYTKENTDNTNTGSIFGVFSSLQEQWFETMLNASKAMSQSIAGASQIDPTAGVKAWTEAEPAWPVNLMPDFLNSINAYGSMLKLWENMGRVNASRPGALGTARTTASSAWLRAWTTMFQNWFHFTSDFSKQANDDLEAEGAPTKTVKDTYLAWLASYEKTLGRFVNMPTIGPARESIEIVERNIDAALKYQAAASDFYSKLFQTTMAALDEVARESRDLLDEEVDDQTVDRLYMLFLDIGERHYQEFFSSPLFGQSLKAMVNTSLDFHKAKNDLIEEMLDPTPVVTQSQADEIHQEIYRLKKRVFELERNQATLKQPY